MNFKSSGSAGDIVYSLPTVLSLLHKEGQEKATFLLQTGVRADYYKGCVHPAGDLRMNDAIANAVIPLIASQEWCGRAKLWEGEGVDVDLDLFRMIPGIQWGHLPRHYFYCFDAWYDLSQPWLDVAPLPGIQDRLVVGRTSRYQANVKYEFMDEFKPLFVGIESEYEAFRKDVPNSEWIRTSDFLEMAQVIAGARAFVGNQSCAFAIAEALKVPRCLESCGWAKNVLPQGGEARDAVNPAGFEANVRQLMAAR